MKLMNIQKTLKTALTRKQKSYKELETENTRGKKRYIERLIEDEEAAQRIEEFLDQARKGNPEQEEETKEQDNVRPFS